MKRVAFEDILTHGNEERKLAGMPDLDVAGWFAAEGFVKGRNLDLFDMRLRSQPEPPGWLQRAREIVASRPDAFLVLGAGGPFPVWLKRMTNEVPIVFYAQMMNPVQLRLVESLRRPGGNVTGTVHPPVNALTAKMWEVFKALKPTGRRVGILLGRQASFGFWMPEYREAWREAGAQLGLEAVEILLDDDAKIDAIERAVRDARVDFLEARDGTEWPFAGLYALQRRTGVLMMGVGWDISAGALFALELNDDEMGREAVRITAKILRGESPATIPVYQSSRFTLTLNRKAAREMNFVFPPALVLRADRVVE